MIGNGQIFQDSPVSKDRRSTQRVGYGRISRNIFVVGANCQFKGSATDLKGKRVGVIGSGATSIQVVPSLQPNTKSMQVYVRSPTYILPTVGFGVESSSYNEICRFSGAFSSREAADGAGVDTADEQKKFSDDAAYYRKFRKGIEQQMNENFLGSIKNSKAQEEGRQVITRQLNTHFMHLTKFQWAEKMMKQSIPSEDLQEKLIPRSDISRPGLVTFTSC